MAEDVELNTTVGEIVALDLDEGINGNILFEIVSGNTDLFSLVTMQIDSRQTFSSMLVNNMVSIIICCGQSFMPWLFCFSAI